MKINYPSLLTFTGVFILLTILGALSHEGGHIIVAKLLGYKTVLHYGSMNYGIGEKVDMNHQIFISLGGPLQTILTGILGLIILKLKNSFSQFQGSVVEWFGVFCALFWSRQVFNLGMGLFGGIFLNARNYFGGDEARIARYLDLPEGIFAIGTGLLGTFVVGFIVLRIIPSEKRLAFVLGGGIGSIAGYLLWFEWLGPLVLP